MFRLSKLLSFWAFVGLVLLLGLQAFPVTGIVLMMLGATFWAGLLVHVFLLTLLFEAIVGRVPLILAVVPSMAYGSYYILDAHETMDIARKSAEMRGTNPGKVLDFNPELYSLVTANAGSLVSSHEIPVAYESNENFLPEGHLSYRLIRRDQCGLRKDSQHRILLVGVHRNDVFQQQVCLLRFPEQPLYKIVSAVRFGDDDVWKRKWGISEQITEVSVDGAVIGSFRTASIWRLPVFPLLTIGCGLISGGSPAWKCGADFLRSYESVDSVPERVDSARYDSPESVMLGIRKYTASDLADFRGFEQNTLALARIAEEPNRVENDAFDVLKAIVDGANPKPPFNMGYSIAQNPERLAPFAEAMAKRFVELNQSVAEAVPNREEQVRALATGLAALPRASFMKVSGLILEAIRQEDFAWDRFPVLYVRAADAGDMAFEFYKKDFMADKFKSYLRMLPVLAICRIGRADPETISEMKRRFVAGHAASGARYEDTSALFVTLLKLGEESFLRETSHVMPKPWRVWMDAVRGWRDAVLANKGTTEVGPNNCMPQEWTTTDYLGPIMEPALKWGRDGWSMRAQK